MEKESEKKMAEIEGRVYTLWNFEQNLQFFCVTIYVAHWQSSENSG